MSAGSYLLDEYFDLVDTAGLQRSPGNFKFYLSYLFNSVSFAGTSVLDIGGGSGYLGFYAACRGAREVVCLEPEAGGTNLQMNRTFSRLQSELPNANVERFPCTIQDYRAEKSFDLVLMHNSINHVIGGCPTLREDPLLQHDAQQTFVKIFDLCERDAKFLIVDNSRHHAFQLLGMKNPLMPHVGWRHHETPEFWMGMLEEVGFKKESLCWGSLNTFRRPGRILMNNSLAAYVLGLPFILTVSRPARS